jgi:hypothetical protein
MPDQGYKMQIADMSAKMEKMSSELAVREGERIEMQRLIEKLNELIKQKECQFRDNTEMRNQ